MNWFFHVKSEAKLFQYAGLKRAGLSMYTGLVTKAN